MLRGLQVIRHPGIDWAILCQLLSPQRGCPQSLQLLVAQRNLHVRHHWRWRKQSLINPANTMCRQSFTAADPSKLWRSLIGLYNWSCHAILPLRVLKPHLHISTKHASHQSPLYHDTMQYTPEKHISHPLKQLLYLNLLVCFLSDLVWWCVLIAPIKPQGEAVWMDLPLFTWIISCF